jgi:uncharacterized protein YdhG (YjbR/CyaY superfamily)
VDEYVAAQPEEVRGILESVRRAIRNAVPGADEVISYKIPTYKLHGRVVVHFGVWTEHLALYPGSLRGIAEAFKHELAPYEVAKGTIRFPLSEPIPLDLIERIAKFRASASSESS